MATANPPVREREDNYEIELSRVRDKIRAQFGDLTDRLKCRERELLEELDTVLASYRSYRDEFEIVRDKVRDLEMMKQRNEEELATSQFKMLQEKIIRQIEEEIKTMTYPKEPQLVTFVCDTNVIFSVIDKLGRNVMGELLCEVRGELNTRPTTSPNPSKWKGFENPAKETQHTRRFTHTISSSFEFGKILADKPVNDLSSISSRTEMNSNDRLTVNDSENEFWGCGRDRKEDNKRGKMQMKVRSEYLSGVESKSSLQPSHTSTSYSNNSSLKIISSNEDVIEFHDEDKPYFEFSPHSNHNVYLDGIAWKTLNHYFQAQKFTTKKEKNEIADTPTPDRATYLANKKLPNFQTFGMKEIIMKRGLEAKFKQHPDLRRMLLATGTKKLTFIHPTDTFWGTGKYNGENKLGELLTKLRQKLSIPTASSNPIPVKLPHPNLLTCSPEDESTTHKRNVKGQVSYDNRPFIYPPRQQVTPQRKLYFFILILILIIIVLIRWFYK